MYLEAASQNKNCANNNQGWNLTKTCFIINYKRKWLLSTGKVKKTLHFKQQTGKTTMKKFTFMKEL